MNEILCIAIRKFKDKKSVSERALKARERQSLHALSVERYKMTSVSGLQLEQLLSLYFRMSIQNC